MFWGHRSSPGQRSCAHPRLSDTCRRRPQGLRAHALSYGADAAEVDRAIAALKPPQHGIYDTVIDLGGRNVTITHLGRGHTMADLVVVAPAPDDEAGPVVVFTGDLVEESADPYIDADSDLQAWPATLDRLLAVGGPDAIYVPGHGHVVDAEFVASPARLVAATCAPRKPVERELLCCAGGDECIRVGHAYPQLTHRH